MSACAKLFGGMLSARRYVGFYRRPDPQPVMVGEK
jgi:hypothetical protein